MKNPKLKKFAGIDDCLGGACPTIYTSEEGKFFVQGYSVSKVLMKNARVPEGEGLVEIPKELLLNATAKLMGKSK